MDQPLLSSKSLSDKQLRCLKIGLLIYNQPKGKNRKTVYIGMGCINYGKDAVETAIFDIIGM